MSDRGPKAHNAQAGCWLGQRMVRGFRRRYLALVVEPPLPPPAWEAHVLAELARASERLPSPREAPRIFHLGAGKAIARLDHRAQETARSALDGARVAGARLRTVTTSGTMRQAKAALGVRSSPRRRRPARKAREAKGFDKEDSVRRPRTLK